MSQDADIISQLPLAWPSYIAGDPVQTDDTLEVRYPWDGSLTGTLPKITPEQLEQAIQAGLGQAQPPTKVSVTKSSCALAVCSPSAPTSLPI